MILSVIQPMCAECGDRFLVHPGDCCGRCQRIVCRACSQQRGRHHESVMCLECAGQPKPTGLRRTILYRALRRAIAG